jgi:hypothetical protein
MKTVAFLLFQNKKLKSKQENGGGVSFRLPDVLFHMGSILSRSCLRAVAFTAYVHHFATVAISTQHLFASFGSFSHVDVRL